MGIPGTVETSVFTNRVERAKTVDTRSRRIGQMLDELAHGGVYMGMQHAPSRKNGS